MQRAEAVELRLHGGLDAKELKTIYHLNGCIRISCDLFKNPDLAEFPGSQVVRTMLPL